MIKEAAFPQLLLWFCDGSILQSFVINTAEGCIQILEQDTIAGTQPSACLNGRVKESDGTGGNGQSSKSKTIPEKKKGQHKKPHRTQHAGAGGIPGRRYRRLPACGRASGCIYLFYQWEKHWKKRTGLCIERGICIPDVFSDG